MSKIAKVEPIPVSYPEPNDFNALRHLCLVKITTDDGVVGWGESITQFPEANFAVKAIIDGMAERVVGKDPLQNGAIWHSIRDKAWWYGYGGGLASYAVARRNRDFESQTQVLATNYQVLVAEGHLAKAQDVLSRPAPSN